MKLALVVPEFPPDVIGGGGPVFESLAVTLSRRGHDVRVLTSATWHGPKGNDAAYGFPISRIPQFRHVTSQFKTYMPPIPFALAGVRGFLAGMDAYHLHGYGTPFIDTIFNLFVPSERTIFTSHGFPYTVRVTGGVLGAAYRLYDRLFGSRILRKSARLTAVSSAVAQEIRAYCGREVSVVPNGFVPIEPDAVPDPQFTREIAKGPYLLGVGRLEPLKGFDYAIEGVAALRAQGLDMRLMIAGADNGQERTLRDLAARRGVADAVSFLGAVPRSQLAHLYRAASCVLVTSKTESFSLVTLEALANGTPCVASAVGGILDIVRDGENGMLFPAGDVRAMVDAIRQVSAPSPFRDALVSKGRHTVERFTWDEVAASYERVYEACF